MTRGNDKIYKYNKKEYKCPLEAAMDLLAGKWRALIIWHLIKEDLRFSQIQKIVPGISKKVLSEHLRVMEQNELIERTVYPEVPPRVEYNITKKGKSLFEPLNYLENWAKQNMEKK
ncbi:MAG: winged helix-turn-helix transcriptional regulator [Poseidonibacter sp.]|uniref:winged helix-turn-helix transcriptional regulator n=1 Tax=Poseidonibacter sp. TaxID=2321188 RepID=UPI00359EBF5A